MTDAPMRMRFVPVPNPILSLGGKFILVIDRVDPNRWDSMKASDFSGPWECVLIFHEEIDIDLMWNFKEKYVTLEATSEDICTKLRRLMELMISKVAITYPPEPARTIPETLYRRYRDEAGRYGEGAGDVFDTLIEEWGWTVR